MPVSPIKSVTASICVCNNIADAMQVEAIALDKSDSGESQGRKQIGTLQEGSSKGVAMIPIPEDDNDAELGFVFGISGKASSLKPVLDSGSMTNSCN